MREDQPVLTCIARGLLQMRFLILVLIILSAAACLPGVFRMNITVNMEDFFLEDDPVLEGQREFRRLFGSNDFIGVLVESEDVFSRETLELIRDVGNRLKESVPLADSVVSLGETGRALPGVPGLKFEGDRLISTDEEVEQVRRACLEIPSMAGTLFSRDSRQAWILLSLHPYPSREEWEGKGDPLFAVGEAAYETVRAVDAGSVRLTATGVPVYAFRKEAEMMEDLMRVLLFGAAVALILSVLIIRSVQGVAGTLLVIAFSVLGVFGIQGWAGGSADSAFLAVPILLSMGVSIGYTVHLSRFFTIRFRQTGKRSESVVYALQESGKPILFTAFTTIAALLSFLFVEVQPIRWVGFTSASCILAVYGLSMVLFPLLLSLGKDRDVSAVPLSADRFEPVLRGFSRLVGRHDRLITVSFVCLGALALFGISRLEIDFNAEKMMGTRLPHMQDQIRIGQSEIATSDTLDLVITLPPGSLKESESLQRIEELEEEIRRLPLVKKTSSLAGTVREFNFLRHGREAEYDRIPLEAPRLRGLMNFFERISPEALRNWVDDDFSTTRIFIELSDFSSREIEGNITRIGELVGEIFPPGTEFFLSGSTYQMALMNQYITRGLVRSVLTALIMITVLMMIVFRSVRLGLAAMIPNVFPVLIAGGIMGLADIPLEFVTMTVAPMIMGLAVDDTIHLLSHLRKEMKGTSDFTESLSRTFSTVGTAITETTVILCLTFLVFTVSDVNSIRNMGILTCSGMLAAYLADIFVTPILIRRMTFRKGRIPAKRPEPDPAA